jgi:hypothetical protein
MMAGVLRCKECNGINVQLVYWCNPNSKEVDWGEPVFDMNQAPSNIGVQWCGDCREHVEMVEEAS